jgi:hypothetical protein
MSFEDTDRKLVYPFLKNSGHIFSLSSKCFYSVPSTLIYNWMSHYFNFTSAILVQRDLSFNLIMRGESEQFVKCHLIRSVAVKFTLPSSYYTVKSAGVKSRLERTITSYRYEMKFGNFLILYMR